MKTPRTSTLTDRILDILAAGPATCDDVWDRLADSSIRRADVARELATLCAESRVTLSYPMNTALDCVA